MLWTRSETLALAAPTCTMCRGLGLRNGRLENTQPCNCALRAIFRACYARFYVIASNEKSISRLNTELPTGREGLAGWGRKDEEFVADFCLVSRRALNDFEHGIFKYHFLLGGDWRICCQRLHTNRGSFFHAVYRIQQKLGRVFRELQPYPLYPISDYFHGPSRAVAPATGPKYKVVPIRPPVANPIVGGAGGLPGKKSA
ncbi:MAG: hypothetical protein M3O35_15875 [Acidobacteriota bacterium]|nr:hypothetical protein [Acidobacteriota bacterium]